MRSRGRPKHRREENDSGYGRAEVKLMMRSGARQTRCGSHAEPRSSSVLLVVPDQAVHLVQPRVGSQLKGELSVPDEWFSLCTCWCTEKPGQLRGASRAQRPSTWLTRDRAQSLCLCLQRDDLLLRSSNSCLIDLAIFDLPDQIKADQRHSALVFRER